MSVHLCVCEPALQGLTKPSVFRASRVPADQLFGEEGEDAAAAGDAAAAHRVFCSLYTRYDGEWLVHAEWMLAAQEAAAPQGGSAMPPASWEVEFETGWVPMDEAGSAALSAAEAAGETTAGPAPERERERERPFVCRPALAPALNTVARADAAVSALTSSRLAT